MVGDRRGAGMPQDVWPRLGMRRIEPVIGSGLMFSLKATYDEIVDALGEPDAEGVDTYKIQARWYFQDNLGRRGGIWDYRSVKPVEDITEWSAWGDQYLLEELLGAGRIIRIR